MGELDNYKVSCEYIRKEFGMTDDVSLYALVTRITEAYKDLKDLEEVRRLKEEELALEAKKSPKKEKQRGRPRK